ncbi:tripartite tricarboxylate transporter permease [Aliivibrio sifiae]|uniref:DUF112 domain-containing protein n=1 Tax=Aliivibrio sifiae TaxID=566293 RepID=A0A2S7XES3_9GAMM|nr:tripartite tricarboxylate transporter permease [Aliivibrio sifiae]PQJ89672.1 hypothetical protein BTO22_08795 [Aliivibrio sifiae]
MLDGILAGLSTAIMPTNLMMVMIGCFVGTFIGMLPGLGPISVIALMLPMSYGLDPASGMILMASVYYGAVFGGSTSSILINAPGCSSTVVTAFDGYPMAQKGQAGKALALAAYSSFTGGTLSAIMLGALIAYGIQPGPRLFVDHPDIVWSVIISMYFGNIVLVILNLPLIPYISKLLAIPRTVLMPMVLFFSITGVYLVSFNTIDVFIMILIAMVAIALRLANFPLAPLLFGFILGGMMEENLRRALMISDGELSFLWERPITFTFTAIAAIVLILPMVLTFVNKIIRPKFAVKS